MKTQKPIENQTNCYALDKTRSSLELANAIEKAKQRAADARAELQKAEAEITSHTKAHRDQSRSDDRRAMLVGRIVLLAATELPNTWAQLWPRIEKFLETESDADRALFGLPPAPRIDVAEVSAATNVTPKDDAAAPPAQPAGNAEQTGIASRSSAASSPSAQLDVDAERSGAVSDNSTALPPAQPTANAQQPDRQAVGAAEAQPEKQVEPKEPVNQGG